MLVELTPAVASAKRSWASVKVLVKEVRLRTIAYVDGFNLYFGALRRTPHRWLDLKRLVELHLKPHHQIVGVLNPQVHPCTVLKANATFYKHLRPNFVAAAQFPQTLTDAQGTFTKPPTW